MTAEELGITKPQLAVMQRAVNKLERDNDAIAISQIRREIGIRLVEIRMLLRDGHLNNLNGRRDQQP